MSEIEKKKRPKFKVMDRGPFENLVRIVYDLLKREKELPSMGDVSADLKLLDISPNSQWGPSAKEAVAKIKEEERLKVRIQTTTTNFERARQLREAEIQRQKEIARETLKRIKERRSEESYGESSMANIGFGGGKGRKETHQPNSDGEYPID